MNSERVLMLTDGTFDADLASAVGPVLVDFWGHGCAPCARLAPIVASLADEYAGRVVVATINVHDHPDTATRFRVRSVPTLLLFRGGQVVESIVGWVPRERIAAAMNRQI